MIGLCFLHDGDAWPERMGRDLGGRFAAALGIGRGGPVLFDQTGGAILAARRGEGRPARTGRQPSLSPARAPDGSLVLFTGRIDNRAELVAALGAAADGAPDEAALYAAAYGAWGDRRDLEIIGQYAAIIWHPDRRAAQLSRSPIDAPPLHVWQDGACAIVASTAGAIFACGVERRIDERKIADSLFLNYADAERGWFANVARLPAGTQGTLSRGGLQLRRYWDVGDVTPVRLPRDEDYVEAADALFRRATKAALAGFSRPAVSLSGGLDSQAVAAYALAELPQDTPLLGLTGVPEAGWDGQDAPGTFGDESAHVRAFGQMYDRLEIELVDAAGLSFDHRLDAMFLLAGAAPRNAINLHWIHEVRSRARSRGCDVLLTGDRGNMTLSFAGRGALPTWLRNGAWGRLRREIALGREPGQSRLRKLASQAVRPLLPHRVQALIDRPRGLRPVDPLDTWCPLNPAWAREMDVAGRARDNGYDPHFRPFASTAAGRRYAMLNSGNEGGDIMQALQLLHGIPSSDPTAWRPLVEFCAAIPDDQYLRDGVPRWLARRMLAGKVPDMVLAERRRGRQAADWPLRLGRQRPALIAEIDRLAADPCMAARFDLPRLRAALADWDGTRPPNGSRQGATLLAALPRALATARFIRYVEGRNDG